MDKLLPDSSSMSKVSNLKFKIKIPHGLSSRSKWLRDYYFQGVNRKWNNEFMSFTTGISGDRIWGESDYYIVPDIYFYMGNGIFGGYEKPDCPEYPEIGDEVISVNGYSPYEYYKWFDVWFNYNPDEGITIEYKNNGTINEVIYYP